MKKTKTSNQQLFDLHLEYSLAATAAEKDYRHLEGKFALAFGYLPIHLTDETFEFLTENQQNACEAFWKNKRVLEGRKKIDSARMLADAYFSAHADLGAR